MTSRIEKTVFISYRRTDMPWALAVYQDLTHHGYDVFIDYLTIPSGDFEKIITENIRGRAHFIVLLTPRALERCIQPGDWLRLEIETAIDEKRNIVPLMLENFKFSDEAISIALTGKLERLRKYNALNVPSDYFFEAMARLRHQFISTPLDAVIQPVSKFTKQVTQKQIAAANKADAVQKDELSLQWLDHQPNFEKQKITDKTIDIRTRNNRKEWVNTLLMRYLLNKDETQKGFTQEIIDLCKTKETISDATIKLKRLHKMYSKDLNLLDDLPYCELLLSYTSIIMNDHSESVYWASEAINHLKIIANNWNLAIALSIRSSAWVEDNNIKNAKEDINEAIKIFSELARTYEQTYRYKKASEVQGTLNYLHSYNKSLHFLGKPSFRDYLDLGRFSKNRNSE